MRYVRILEIEEKTVKNLNPLGIKVIATFISSYMWQLFEKSSYI